MIDALVELDHELAVLAANDELSGVVFLARGSETVFEGAYGWASRTWRIPMTFDMRFDCASITKLFTAVATFQRVDAGDFDLDTSAIDYLGLVGTAISAEVTVRHLLNHTSGIADDADEEAGERYEDLFVDKANYSEIETADHLPDFVFKPPNFAPGAGSRYCNCSFILLGLMIEKATGVRYREYVCANVFARAGMTRSGFFHMERIVPDVAEPCEPVRNPAGAITGWKRNVYSYPPIGSPDGGAHVTASDLVKFMDDCRAARLMSAAHTELMFSPQAQWQEREGGAAIWFGSAAKVWVDGTGNVVWFGKEGVNVGSSCDVTYYLAHDVTAVVLTTAEDAAWGPVKRLDELITSGALDTQ